MGSDKANRGDEVMVQVFLVVWLLVTPGFADLRFFSDPDIPPIVTGIIPDMEIILTRGSLADCERVAEKLSRRPNVVAWCIDDEEG